MKPKRRARVNSRIDTDLGAVIQSKEWPCTVAGWVWYCDMHDTHGNADVEAEARAGAQAHAGFYDECDLYVMKVEPRAGR